VRPTPGGLPALADGTRPDTATAMVGIIGIGGFGLLGRAGHWIGIAAGSILPYNRLILAILGTAAAGYLAYTLYASRRIVRCRVSARFTCPAGCGIFEAFGPDRTTCLATAYAACVAAGCNRPPCECGHPRVMP
jgi:hypothetical protein